MISKEIYAMNAQDLLNSVVVKAAKDYRTALVVFHRFENDIVWKETDEYKKAKEEVDKLERFFKVYSRSYTGYPGEKLMEEIKNEVIAYNYDLRALYDSHLDYKKEEEL